MDVFSTFNQENVSCWNFTQVLQIVLLSFDILTICGEWISHQMAWKWEFIGTVAVMKDMTVSTEASLGRGGSWCIKCILRSNLTYSNNVILCPDLIKKKLCILNMYMHIYFSFNTRVPQLCWDDISYCSHYLTMYISYCFWADELPSLVPNFHLIFFMYAHL